MSHKPSVLDVLIWPDPKLKIVSEEVETFDENLLNFASDMFTTMSALSGVGLAAPQVGRPIRMICIRIEEEKPLILINPKVEVFDDTPYEWEEGCLSVPGYFKKNKRPNVIAVDFQDIEGKPHNVQFQGLYAFAIQHEIDHLNGICFVDNESRIWHSKIKKKIREGYDELQKKAAMARIQLAEMQKQKQEGAE